MNIEKIKKDRNYAIEGGDFRGVLEVVARLYDDSKPLKIDERRDMAQRLDALLSKYVELAE